MKFGFRMTFFPQWLVANFGIPLLFHEYSAFCSASHFLLQQTLSMRQTAEFTFRCNFRGYLDPLPGVSSHWRCLNWTGRSICNLCQSNGLSDGTATVSLEIMTKLRVEMTALAMASGIKFLALLSHEPLIFSIKTIHTQWPPNNW